jgi:hypothetical protein
MIMVYFGPLNSIMKEVWSLPLTQVSRMVPSKPHWGLSTAVVIVETAMAMAMAKKPMVTRRRGLLEDFTVLVLILRLKKRIGEVFVVGRRKSGERLGMRFI